jgi:predicted lipoprotein with Yx(FWY)xxD motif
MIRLLLLLLLLPAAARGAGLALNWTDMRPDLGTNTLAYPFNWSLSELHIPEGNWYHRHQTGQGAETFNIPLQSEQPAGIYNFWLLATRPSTPPQGTIVLGFGGILVTNTYTNTSWSRVTASAPAAAFTNVTVNVMHTIAGIEDTYLGGIYLTTNSNEGLVTSGLYHNSDWIFRDYTVPDVTNSLSVPGNLIPNSSWELGLAAGGYAHGRNRDTTFAGFAQRLEDAESWSGGYDGAGFVSIQQTNKVRFALYLPVTRIDGPLEKQQLTLSFWAKSASGSTLTITFGSVLPQVPGLPVNQFTWTRSVGPAVWTRFSTNFYFAPVPTPEMALTFSTVGYVDLDAVQLERGPLTDYAPRKPVEFAMSTGRTGNTFDLSEPPSLFLRTYNVSAPTTRLLTYSIRDTFNRLVGSGTTNISVPAGRFTNTIPAVLTNRGANRVTAYLSSDPMYQEELVYLWAPLYFGNLITNSVLGNHPEPYGPLLSSNKLFGVSHSRTLSPGGMFRWSAMEPASNVFDWTQTDYRVNAMSNVTLTLGSLQEQHAPSHARTSNYPRLDRLHNYVTQVVHRYKGSIRMWEGWNELNLWSSESGYSIAQQAAIEDTVALAVKTADPTSYYIAMGGIASAVNASNTWAVMTQQTNVDAISVHLYSGDQPAGSSADTRYASFAAWAPFMGRPILNTESGAWSLGLRKGNVLGWSVLPTYFYPTDAEHVVQRAYSPGNETMYAFIRSAGHGFLRYYFYDARVDFFSFREMNTEAALYDYDDSVKADWGMLMWARSLFDPPDSYAKFTHPSASSVEAYLFGKSGKSVLFVFSNDKTNRTATITNTAIGVFDQFGNLQATNSATIPVNNHPWAWVSALATNQLAQTFTNAVLSGASSVVAPVVSIDTTPTGDISSTNDFPLTLRWAAISPTYKNTARFPSNVFTRFKLVGSDSDWSAWSATRFTRRPSLTSGSYQLQVQAKDFEGLATNEVSGPAFTVDQDGGGGGGGSPPASGSATANTGTAGTVTVLR